MDEKFYKVKEVADIHGITKKTLQHYEKIGIYKPDYIDENNNYKYYKRENFPFLKQIIYFKDIGLSLKEIKNLLEKRDYNLLLNKLYERKEIVNKEIQNLKRTVENIDNTINTYKNALNIKENDLNRVSIKLLQKRKAILKEVKKNNNKSIMLAYRESLKTLRKLGEFSHLEYGTMYSEDEYSNVSIFIFLPDKTNVKHCITLEEGKYLTMYHKGSYYDYKAVKYMLNWIKRNGYDIDGYFFDICIVDRTFVEAEEDMVFELQVKVK